jgi:hypothetical protein
MRLGVMEWWSGGKNEKSKTPALQYSNEYGNSKHEEL